MDASDEYTMEIKKKLVGKTIKSVVLSGYTTELYFTDGSKFEYDASDGGYSTYDLYEKED